MSAKDRSHDKRRVFENVRILPRLGGFEGTKLDLEGKGLSDITVSNSHPGAPTAVAKTDRIHVTETGATHREARQKAYNKASTKKVENAKSGKTAKDSMAAEPIVGKRNVVKINTDPTKGN
jgi:hypothetical protein